MSYFRASSISLIQQSVGLASEANTAFAAGKAKSKAIGIASEIDVTFNVVRGGNLAPVWQSNINQSIGVDVPFSLNLDTLCTDPEGQPLTYFILSGSLPAGLSQSGARGQTISGTPTTVQTVNVTFRASDGGSAAAEADWLARSTAAGVLYATDFRDLNDFVTASSSSGGRGKWGADGGLGQAAHEACVVQDTSDGITGGACLRIDNPLDNRGSQAAWICSMNPAWTTKTQGMGTTAFWVQWRHKIPSSRLVQQPGVGIGGLSDGPKMINFAAYDPQDPRNGSRSNTTFEHVIQHVNWRTYPQAYRRTSSGSYVGFGEEPYSPTSTFKMQNAIDRGAQFTHADRFCLLNDPHSCFLYVADVWTTYMARIRVATYDGTAGNEFDLWAAPQGASSWTHLYTQQNHNVGAFSDGFTGGFNGCWLLLYETNRTNPGSVVTHQLWDQLIVSTQEIALPQV